MSVALAVRGLRSGYGSVEVLHGVDLDVPRGAVTALLGVNGAGKTTTLRTLAGVVPTRAGTVTWEGRSLGTTSAYDRARAGLLLVPERGGVFSGLTVRDNLAAFAGDGRGDSATALASFPVLAERLDQVAGSLSGGEQQMLALSRALVQRPSLLLLDEVSLGLAPQVTARLYDVVGDLVRDGATVLVVEQYLDVVVRLAEVVHVLERGEVVFTGEPGELAARRRARAG